MELQEKFDKLEELGVFKAWFILAMEAESELEESFDLV